MLYMLNEESIEMIRRELAKPGSIVNSRDDGSELSEEHRDLALTVLGLTVAAGGKIVCRHADMMDIGRYRLTVTEDSQTGDKIYEAKPL
jgi:hypothetical protein